MNFAKPRVYLPKSESKYDPFTKEYDMCWPLAMGKSWSMKRVAEGRSTSLTANKVYVSNMKENHTVTQSIHLSITEGFVSK